MKQSKIKTTKRDIDLVESMSLAQARLANASEEILTQFQTRKIELVVEGPLHTIRTTVEVL